MFKRILLPIDGSELASQAARVGIQLAREQGAEVVLLHAQATQAPAFIDLAYIDAETQAALEKAGRAAAERILDDAEELAKAAEVKSSKVTAMAIRPESLIVQVCRDMRCDLVVIATHGRGALGRFMMGSVSQRLLESAEVPVLVIRPQT